MLGPISRIGRNGSELGDNGSAQYSRVVRVSRDIALIFVLGIGLWLRNSDTHRVNVFKRCFNSHCDVSRGLLLHFCPWVIRSQFAVEIIMVLVPNNFVLGNIIEDLGDRCWQYLCDNINIEDEIKPKKARR